MTKKQRLQQEIFNLKAMATALLEREGVTRAEITDAQNKIETAQAKLKLLEETEEQIVEVGVNARAGEIQSRVGTVLSTNVDADARYEQAFYNSLRGRGTVEDREILDVRNEMSSNVEEDGGLLIPIDQQNSINELKRQYSPLRNLVSVEPVSTLTGNRVLEKDAEHVPFNEFAENEELKTTETPKFTTIGYKIKSYGGILPVPRTLMADQKANLKGYLNKWLAKKSVATENSIILALLGNLNKKALSGIDDIKDVLDIDLDPAISALASIVTNQDGFNYLNKLKDTQGNYILEKDPKNPTKKLLSGKELIILSNKVLKTTGTTTKKAPMIIGSLKEAIVLFDRESISLVATEIGGDSFKNNRVDIRAIMRLDAQHFDKSSAIYGELTLTKTGA
ncbi:MAG: phage major capsid protein [Fusobacteriaceae bacterium]